MNFANNISDRTQKCEITSDASIYSGYDPIQDGSLDLNSCLIFGPDTNRVTKKSYSFPYIEENSLNRSSVSSDKIDDLMYNVSITRCSDLGSYARNTSCKGFEQSREDNINYLSTKYATNNQYGPISNHQKFKFERLTFLNEEPCANFLSNKSNTSLKQSDIVSNGCNSNNLLKNFGNEYMCKSSIISSRPDQFSTDFLYNNSNNTSNSLSNPGSQRLSLSNYGNMFNNANLDLSKNEFSKSQDTVSSFAKGSPSISSSLNPNLGGFNTTPIRNLDHGSFGPENIWNIDQAKTPTISDLYRDRYFDYKNLNSLPGMNSPSTSNSTNVSTEFEYKRDNTNKAESFGEKFLKNEAIDFAKIKSKYQGTGKAAPGFGDIKTSSSGEDIKKLKGKMFNLSTEQVGSRVIQECLQNANESTLIELFKEISPNIELLVTDMFGNYVIQKFLELGNVTIREKICKAVLESTSRLSLQVYGCRVIQKIIIFSGPDIQKKIMSELKPVVLESIHDINGNHVMQKAIEFGTISDLVFITQQIEGQILSLCTHQFGCHVLQRLIERLFNHTFMTTLVEKIKGDINLLVKNKYGNYVIQHILKFGDKKQKEMITSEVSKNFFSFSKHKYASNAVEKSLEYLSKKEFSQLIKSITTKSFGETPIIAELIRNQFGNYVVQKLISLSDYETQAMLLEGVEPYLKSIKNNMYSKRLSIKVEQILSRKKMLGTKVY
ncbi:Pumilio-like protein [Smittium culicis]|uniref:Pumilio-like protein n=1 Tax=Smittium culicis TaxID=133412 RepID=A0A1R1X6X9_9FUNG|nr:Pumilio-like protein [Smittium culicis]